MLDMKLVVWGIKRCPLLMFFRGDLLFLFIDCGA